jgi:hypothetical protein
VSAGNFASLTAGLLVRKGEAEPSPVMPSSEAFPFAQRVVPAPANAPIPVGRVPQIRRHELPAACTDSDAPPKPRRMFLQLSAQEYEALALVAVKKGTTPQHLLRKLLHDFLVEFVEQCDGSCPCIRSGCDHLGQAL